MIPWDEEQVDNVQGLLTQFNGPDEVCAVVGCDPSELDAQCDLAFGMDFETAMKTFAAQGRAYIRRALMQQAMEGNVKAIDMLAREHLGMGAIEQRERNKQAMKGDEDGNHNGNGTLTLLQGRRKDRRSRAAN